jgi:AraC-like DNA-binding protein
MNAITPQQAERETQRLQVNRAELVERILRAVPEDGICQPLPGIFLARVSLPTVRAHSVVNPSFCVIAQGSKEILLGENRFRYDPDHYLITTVELPRVSQVLEASPQQPYLSFRLELTPALVSSVMLEAGQSAHANPSDVRAMDVSPMDVNLLDAVVRLVRFLESPADARMLLPLIQREIVYWLLMGTQAARLRHLVTTGGYTPLIARAVELLHEDMGRPLHVEDLAHKLGISVSGLHYHFKAITAMSPLQFQKQLRLQEARRLMLIEDLDAASTAYRLGYHDAAHFSREYKSLFGVPPIRDVQRLKQGVIESDMVYQLAPSAF